MHHSIPPMPQPKIAVAGLLRPVWSGDKEGQLARSLREMEDLARDWGFAFHPCPDPLLSWEDSQRLRAELDAEGVDFLLLQTSSFGSGDVLMPLLDGRYRMGLWSVPEPTVQGRLPLNSLCGANHLVSVILQYVRDPRGVKWFHGQATDAFFQRRFRVTVDALRGIKRLQGARIGLVGKHATGFQNLFFDRRVVEQRYGVRFYDHELADVFARVRHASPEEARRIAEEMAAQVREVQVDPAALEQVGAMEAALLSVVREGGYDALAVRCWPEWQSEFHRAPCSTLGRLNQLGIPTACEGDGLGAVGMLLLHGIVGEPATIMDMIAFDQADESILLWHCGPTAPSLADEEGVRLTLHFNQRVPVANDMVFRKDHGTILQVMGDGEHIFLLDGEGMGRSKPSYDGSRGWFHHLRMNRQPVALLDIVNTLMAHGLTHHYALALRDCSEAVLEAAAWLGLEPLPPVPYSDARPLASAVRGPQG
ncbi:MAG: hypothetical protein H5T59_00270 [Anaerolineae bacterium]|nr:hypothetical protein [Anaerolineae bacterium]